MSNRTDLISKVAQELDVPFTLSKKVVEVVFQELKKMCVQEPVKIENFGTFELRMSNERTFRNPNTGELEVLPRRVKLAFRPSKNYFREVPQDDGNTRGEDSQH